MRVPKLLPCRGLSTGLRSKNRLSEQVKHSTKPGAPKRTTIDIATVQHHTKLKNVWWDMKGTMYPLHAMNPLRVQLIRDGLANAGYSAKTSYLPLEGVRILDVGCGGGILSEPLARIGAEVTGLDASPELIDMAKDHAQLDPKVSSRLNYVCTSIEQFSPENEDAYDAVVASEVLEHVDDKELFLKCCAEIVRPGGSLFLTTINKTLPSWLGGIIAAEYVLKLVPVGTHDWDKFVSPQEIQRLLETYGCKTKLIHGMMYNPIKNEWTWSASTAINYALQAVKGKGRR